MTGSRKLEIPRAAGEEAEVVEVRVSAPAGQEGG